MHGVILTLVPIQYISKSLYTDTEPPPCCKKWTGFYDIKNRKLNEIKTTKRGSDGHNQLT